MLWKVIRNSAELIFEEFRELFFNHKSKMEKSGNLIMEPRSKHCTAIVEFLMPLGFGSMYVKNYIDISITTSLNIYVEYLHDSFRDIINSSDWMDKKTTEKALEKLNAMKFNISYNDELLNDDYIDDLVKKLPLNESFLAYSILLADFPKEKKNNYWSPTEVNGFYFRSINSIAITASIMQGNFFNSDSPKYMNFAGIGYIIGHEIGHGFDNLGKFFDSHGNIANWWQKETLAKLEEKHSCFVNQYNNYTLTVNEIELPVNGSLTLVGNIADNLGVKAAYLAYQQWVLDNGPEPYLPGLPYSPNQLFWISYAQKYCLVARPEHYYRDIVDKNDHAPFKFRVLGPLNNLQAFADDFNCPEESNMNPRDKCIIW